MVPTNNRPAVLTQLHDGHLRMARMKSFVRMYVWWPGFISWSRVTSLEVSCLSTTTVGSSRCSLASMELANKALG